MSKEGCVSQEQQDLPVSILSDADVDAAMEAEAQKLAAEREWIEYAERRKRQIAERDAREHRETPEQRAERERQSKEAIQEYALKLNGKPKDIGTVAWFTRQMGQRVGERETYRIKNHRENVAAFLKAAYEKEVNDVGCLCIDDNYTKYVIECAAKWMLDHNSMGLILRGNVGVGKTTLMRAMRDVYQIVDNEVITIVDANAIANEAKNDDHAVDKYVKIPMLGIDDLGVEPASVKSWGNDMTPIVELLTERYRMRRFTIITTNLATRITDTGKEVDEIEERYGARVADRLRELCSTLAFDGNQPSYRK